MYKRRFRDISGNYFLVSVTGMFESKIDIVHKLLQGYDAVLMSKKWKPVVAQNDGINLTITQIIPLVQQSSRVRFVIDLISKTTNMSVLELQKIVQTCLQEMGHYRSMSTIRWVGLALCYLIKKNYSGILVNENSIYKVKAIMGSNPVIFAPSHKSYVDFILMSFLCFYYDIEIPVIAAGEDFQNMWLMGRMMRYLCAFFIRRSFGGDELYKAIIAEYLSLVAIHGHAALEFFIEGTRSRSGKSVSPKFGLMTMALEPYFLGRVPDVTVIPVSITYERCLEDQLFARELLGVPKPKESTKLLVRALQVLNENYGRIFVEFGDPISVKDFCCKNVDKDPRLDINLCSGLCPQYPIPEVSKCVKKLCFNIIKEHNKHLSFTAFHMLAASMSTWCAFENKVPIDRLMSDMKFIKDILNKLGYSTIMKESIEEEIAQCEKLHHHVVYQDSHDKCLKLHFGMPSSATVGYPNPNEGHKLSERTLSVVYPAIFIQEYANPVCLVTIHISIVNFILCTTPSHKLQLVNRESLYTDYLFWRNILSVEFVLQDDNSTYVEDFITAVAQMTELNLFFSSFDEGTVVINTHTQDKFHEALLLGLVHPFLAAYSLALDVCIVLASKEMKEISEKELKYVIQKELEHRTVGIVPKSILSLDIINNAVQTFFKIGALEKWNKGNIVMIHPVVKICHIFYREIEDRLDILRTHLRGCHEKLILQNRNMGSKL